VSVESEKSGHNGALCRRTFAGAAAAALTLTALRVANAQKTEPAGLVEDIKGEGFAEAAIARRVLERNSPVFIADLIGTGAVSRLTIHLGQHTRLRLGERVRIMIDRYLVDAGGEFRLESGAMLFDQPSGQPSPIQIRSPFGLIAVRGTRFFAGPSAGVFGVFVERGTVAVTAAGREVVLLMGQGTDIPRPGDKPRTARRWGEPRIRDALASVF
jgi:ferric-dicitrate binding protein FerR (iron transport regulator)